VRGQAGHERLEKEARFRLALALNNSGQVVGMSDTRGGQDHAFLWRDGTMTDLGTLGSQFSQAQGINDSGVIVGYSADAFRYSSGTMSNLGDLPGASLGVAYGINNNGQIVGYSGPDTSHTLAFLYSKGTRGA
jgi:probable HAF family extracellular repeat protein